LPIVSAPNTLPDHNLKACVKIILVTGKAAGWQEKWKKMPGGVFSVQHIIKCGRVRRKTLSVFFLIDHVRLFITYVYLRMRSSLIV
jgi:hypothetical protein